MPFRNDSPDYLERMLPRKRVPQAGGLMGGFGPGASNFSSANSNLGSNHSLLMTGVGGVFPHKLSDQRHLMMSSDADQALHSQIMNLTAPGG